MTEILSLARRESDAASPFLITESFLPLNGCTCIYIFQQVGRFDLFIQLQALLLCSLAAITSSSSFSRFNILFIFIVRKFRFERFTFACPLKVYYAYLYIQLLIYKLLVWEEILYLLFMYHVSPHHSGLI